MDQSHGDHQEIKVQIHRDAATEEPDAKNLHHHQAAKTTPETVHNTLSNHDNADEDGEAGSPGGVDDISLEEDFTDDLQHRRSRQDSDDGPGEEDPLLPNPGEL